VLLRVNGRDYRQLDVAGHPWVDASVVPPRGADVCRFEVIGNGLLGSTRFEFVRP
jgi:hypothetical protein